VYFVDKLVFPNLSIGYYFGSADKIARNALLTASEVVKTAATSESSTTVTPEFNSANRFGFDFE